MEASNAGAMAVWMLTPIEICPPVAQFSAGLNSVDEDEDEDEDEDGNGDGKDEDAPVM